MGDERFIDGLDATIREPQEMAILSIQATVPIWSQNAGNRSEPYDVAYRRLLKRELPVPVMIAAVYHEGRWKTVHTHPGAVVTVYDPARGGWEIRVMRPEMKAAVLRMANLAEKMASRAGAPSPFTIARDSTEADGRIGQAGLRWMKEQALHL